MSWFLHIRVYFIGPVELAKSMGHRGDFCHPEG